MSEKMPELNHKLTGEQRKELEETIINAYPTYEKLNLAYKRIFSEEIGLRVKVSSLESTVSEMISSAESRGELKTLVIGLYNENPNHVKLKQIKEKLFPDSLKLETDSIEPDDRNPKRTFINRLRKLLKPSKHITLASMGITTLTIFMGLFGVLQPLELFFYDQMMQLNWSDNKIDDNLLLIEITEKDAKLYGSGGKASLDDEHLKKLLDILIKLDARTIGLDLLRNFRAEKKSRLKYILENEGRLFVTCKVQSDISEGNAFPPEVDQERAGFNDFLVKDNIVRRQILTMKLEPNKKDVCFGTRKEMSSFNLKLVNHYLKSLKQKEYEKDKAGNLVFGNVVLQDIDGAIRGPYKWLLSNFSGYQVLLNYRRICIADSCDLKNIAQIKHVKDFLSLNKEDNDYDEKLESLKESVKGKLVLIGTDREGIGARPSTPFGVKIQGFVLQAQMVSQLLGAVLGEETRPLIKVLWFWHDNLWIFVWSVAGGIIAYLSPSRLHLMISVGTGFLVLYIVCFILFTENKVWISFVPPTLTLFGTAGAVVMLIKPKA